MKKLLITTALVGSLISAPAFSKNVRSISIEASNIDVEQSFNNVEYLGSENKTRPTVRYSYKGQGEHIFFRPSISYTFGEIALRDTNSTSNKSTLSKIATIEADIGFNITKKTSVFATVGAISATFERDENGINHDKNSNAILAGVGLEYDICKKYSVNAKYQRSDMAFNVSDHDADHKVSTDIFKVGIYFKLYLKTEGKLREGLGKI